VAQFAQHGRAIGAGSDIPLALDIERANAPRRTSGLDLVVGNQEASIRKADGTLCVSGPTCQRNAEGRTLAKRSWRCDGEEVAQWQLGTAEWNLGSV